MTLLLRENSKSQLISPNFTNKNITNIFDGVDIFGPRLFGWTNFILNKNVLRILEHEIL